MPGEEGSDVTGTLERVPSECVSCAIEKGLASEEKTETSLSIDTGVGFVENIPSCQPTPHFFLLCNHNNPKVSDRHVCANSVDPDQTAQVSTLFATASLLFGHISIKVNPHCSTFRMSTAIFSGVQIFRIFTVFI